MDILIELIIEIILDGSLELGTNKRVCLPIRILALVIFLLIYAAVTGVFIIFAMTLWQKGNFGFSILFLAFGLALAIGDEAVIPAKDIIPYVITMSVISIVIPIITLIVSLI